MNRTILTIVAALAVSAGSSIFMQQANAATNNDGMASKQPEFSKSTSALRSGRSVSMNFEYTSGGLGSLPPVDTEQDK